MNVNLVNHHRRSIRLKGYDYSQAGVYFITLVTRQRLMLFGRIEKGEMIINRNGGIIRKWWDNIPEHFPNVETGAFMIMPNHVHGIINIIDDRRGTVSVPRIGANTQMEGMESRGESTSPLQNGGDGMEHQGGMTPPLRKPTLGQIVAYFKYQSTKEINMLDGGKIAKLWHRNYYEHIIRSECEMGNLTNYIETNPARWGMDDENPRK